MKVPSVVDSGVYCIWSGAATCGEGPVWIPEQSALYWVDIDGCKAHRYDITDKQVTTWTLVEKTGWLLPCHGRKEFIAGCKSGVYLIDLDAGVKLYCSIQSMISHIIDSTTLRQIHRVEFGLAL